jgi:putative SOS response-associated peptidase YedK
MSHILQVDSGELDFGEDLEARPDRDSGDGRPSQLLPVVRRHPETGAPTEGYLRWGLIPRDAPTRPSIQPIHARAETLTEKPIFRDAYRLRRCIVPMNLFCVRDRHRKPHAFAVKDNSLFASPASGSTGAIPRRTNGSELSPQ